MRKVIVVSIVILYFFGLTNIFDQINVFADTNNTCTMTISAPNITPGQTEQLTINNIIFQGKPLTSWSGSGLVISVPQSGRVYTPNDNNNPIQNGSIALNLTNDDYGNYIFANNTNNQIQLIQRSTIGQFTIQTLCSSPQLVYVEQEACATGIDYNVDTTSDGQFTVSSTIDTSLLIPNASYDLVLDAGLLHIGGEGGRIQHSFTHGKDDPNNIFTSGLFLPNDASGKTFPLYLKRSNCFEVTGASCAIPSCQTQVKIIPNSSTKSPGTNFPAPGTTGNGTNNIGITCVTNGKTGISTAIGCIPFTSTTDLINFVLGWALGIAGGIAFLLILLAGFQIMISRGDPNRLKAGQELLTSAIAGLVLLIFSIFILRIIGVNILGIFPK